jgi:CRP-like cAMP-binding protein
MKITAEQIIGSRLGKEFSDQEATRLAELMDVRELKADEYLINEGTVDDSLYVVLKGHLEVVKQTASDGIASIAIIREGDLAGELSFLDGDVHTVGLRAIGDSKVISLKQENFEKIVVDEPQLAYKVMRAIARSAHRIMHQMNHDFIELNNYIFKQHGRY